MHCHICNQEAVGRCYTCGALFCQAHGQVNCARCETSIVAGDPRPDHVSAQPFGSGGRPGWWRPQVAEDYDPPACHMCGALARRVCRHCGSLYCSQHAGAGELCAGCTRSSHVGMLAFLGVVLLMGTLMLVGLFTK